MALKPGTPKPVRPAAKLDDPQVEAFVNKEQQEDAPATLPWRTPGVRDDVMVNYYTRVNMRLSVQVDWLIGRYGISKRELTERALQTYIETELKKLGLPTK